MIKFEYDENGKLVAIKDGKKIGTIETMGDNVEKEEKERKRNQGGDS